MCRMNFGFGDACASCVVHARYDHQTLGLKVRLFISSLFIVFAFTKKFLLSHCRYQLSTDEEWIRHNFRYFYSRVSCGAIHCRSNVVNLKMMRLHRISDHKNQSHANAIEFVLLLLFAGATVVSWRVNNQEQLFVRWVETFTKHFSKHCLSLSSKSKCGMRACKEMRRKCQCNTSFVCCGCRRCRAAAVIWTKENSEASLGIRAMPIWLRVAGFWCGKNLTRQKSSAREHTSETVESSKNLHGTDWVELRSLSVGNALFVDCLR